MSQDRTIAFLCGLRFSQVHLGALDLSDPSSVSFISGSYWVVEDIVSSWGDSSKPSFVQLPTCRSIEGFGPHFKLDLEGMASEYKLYGPRVKLLRSPQFDSSRSYRISVGTLFVQPDDFAGF